MIPRVPDELLRSNVSNSQMRTWLAVRKVQGDNTYAWGSQAHYAEVGNQDRATVNRNIKALIKNGWMLQKGRKLQCLVSPKCDPTSTNVDATSQLECDPTSTNVDLSSTKCDPTSTPSESLIVIHNNNPITTTARAKEKFNPAEAYEETFQVPLTAMQTKMINEAIDDRDLFGYVAFIWRANNYKARNVAGFLGRYASEFARRREELLADVQPNDNLPTGAQGGTVPRVRSRTQSGHKRTGALSYAEYLAACGWVDGDEFDVAGQGAGIRPDPSIGGTASLRGGNTETRLLGRTSGGSGQGGSNGIRDQQDGKVDSRGG